MGKQTERQAKLLDAIDMLLRETQSPIHYKELTSVMIDSGMWENPWGKEPDQILYSALHNDVKRSGQGPGRFIFMGGGIFCTSFVDGLDFILDELPVPAHNVTPPDPYKKSGDMPGDSERRRAHAEADYANQRCGNCGHLSWEGPNLHTHEIGSCSQYPDSGRSSVFRHTEPCQRWKRRTPAQVNADRSTPVELTLEAKYIFITGHRPAGSRLR